MGSGGPRGLQIPRSGVHRARGGFDSHAFPPIPAPSRSRGARLRPGSRAAAVLLARRRARRRRLGAADAADTLAARRRRRRRRLADTRRAARRRRRTRLALVRDQPRCVMMRSLADPGLGPGSTTTPGSRRRRSRAPRSGCSRRWSSDEPRRSTSCRSQVDGRAPAGRSTAEALAASTRTMTSSISFVSASVAAGRRRGVLPCWTPTWTRTSANFDARISSTIRRLPGRLRHAARGAPRPAVELLSDPRLANASATSASSRTSITARARSPTGCSSSRTR